MSVVEREKNKAERAEKNMRERESDRGQMER